MEFQAFSWFVDDGSETDIEDMEMTVHIFGKTKSGKSVSVHVREFCPTFCIKFPKDIPPNPTSFEEFTDLLKTKLADWDTVDDKLEMTANYADHLLDDPEKIIRRKNLWGFTNGEQEPFFKLVFKSLKAYNKAKSILRACHNNTLSMKEMEDFYSEWISLVDDRGRKDREAQNDLIKRVSQQTNVRESCLRWICKLGEKELSLAYAKGKLFEVIDPILRFAHLKNLKMAGWVRLLKYEQPDTKTSTCELEYVCTYNDLQPVEKDDICATIKEMAFDIEAYSYDDMFPDPAEPQNYVYQIGITLKHYADPVPRKILLHFRTPESLRGNNSGMCGNIPDTKVINFETEKELLLAFADLIVKEDPDLIYGYNSDMFDWNYLMKRAEVCNCFNRFARLSRFKHYVCKVEAKSFTSSAYGDNKYLRVDIPGRMNVDLMIWIQRNMPADRYPSYALDAVAEKEINENKRDVDAKDIFAAFRSGDATECTRIGDYCCQDTILVQKLVNKLDVLTQMFEMANITDTPPMYLLQKGQQIKVFSQISKKARLKGFLVPLAEDRDDSTFKGAIVLPPIIGMYRSPVSVLDFASLYPSIQVAYNICYTTVVLDDQKYSCENLDRMGIKYDTIEWEDDILQYRNQTKNSVKDFGGLEDAKKFAPRKEIVDNIARNDYSEDITWRWTKKKCRYTFIQNDDSVIPDLQVELKKSRKAVRRLMAPIEHSKDPDDQLRWRVLNGRQLAIKVSMNSIYGFTSAFMLNMMALSASVTAKGRQMIEQTRDFMEKEFNKIALVQRWLQEDVEAYYTKDGKEISVKQSEQPPEGSIRKFPTAVVGQTWADKELSIQVVAGDSVAEDTPVLCQDANGRLLYRTFKNLGSGPWQMRSDGKEYQQCDYRVWSDGGFTKVNHVIRHKTDKKMYRVSTHSGIVDVTEDHSLLDPSGKRVAPTDVHVGGHLLHCDLPSLSSSVQVDSEEYASASKDTKCEKVPDFILNASKDIQIDFIKGCLNADLTESFEMSCNGKLGASGFYHSLSSLGYIVTITSQPDERDVYRLKCLTGTSTRSLDEITGISELPPTVQYVYDIETENHHFHAGPGRLIVHNTDSVFCHFPHNTLAEAISLCHKAEVLLTDTVFNRHPIEMEYEKTYMPIVIQKKKNYVGLKYENDDVRWKVDYKGIAVKRRNYCPLVKEIFWNVIYPTLGVETYGNNNKGLRKVSWNYMEGPERAVQALRESLRRLETRQVDWDDLLISKSLKSSYKSENQPHVQLVKRIKERDPGSEPKSGQRFSMVIVHDDSRDLELSARSEDPKYAKQMGLMPDFIFYLDQQIRKPLTTFLTIIGKGKEAQQVCDHVQATLFEQLRKERSIKELATRKAFLSGQSPTKVPPLKAPKKATVSKTDKMKNLSNSHADISSFFGRGK